MSQLPITIANDGRSIVIGYPGGTISTGLPSAEDVSAWIAALKNGQSLPIGDILLSVESDLVSIANNDYGLPIQGKDLPLDVVISAFEQLRQRLTDTGVVTGQLPDASKVTSQLPVGQALDVSKVTGQLPVGQLPDASKVASQLPVDKLNQVPDASNLPTKLPASGLPTPANPNPADLNKLPTDKLGKAVSGLQERVASLGKKA